MTREAQLHVQATRRPGVIWAALVLVALLVAVGVCLWYVSGRQLAARTQAQQWQALRRGYMVSAVVGAAILALGVVAFVLTSYDWALALIWAFGLLHLGLLLRQFRSAQQRYRPAGADRRRRRPRSDSGTA